MFNNEKLNINALIFPGSFEIQDLIDGKMAETFVQAG